MDLITVKNLSYSYDSNTPFEKKALDKVSLSIQKGEFIGLIGKTGSGKTTLVKFLNGLKKPTEGNILFEGEDIFSPSFPLKALRGKVGLVFQFPEHQLFEETVLKDVMFGPKNLGIRQEEAKKKAKESLALLGMDKTYWNRSPFALSGGEKRRVALAGVLAMSPEVLVLDEPAAGLDPYTKKELFELLKKLNQEGTTILVISHSMDDMAEYASRVIYMENGSIQGDGKPSDVFKALEEKPEVLLLADELRAMGYPIGDETIRLEELSEAIVAFLKP